MKLIRRYDLSLEPVQKLAISNSSEILCIREVNGKPSMFVLVDDQDSRGERKFHIFASGKEIPQRLNRTFYEGCFEYKAEVGSHWLHVFRD